MVVLNPSSASVVVTIVALEVDTALTAVGPADPVVQGEIFSIAGVLTRVDTVPPTPIANMTIELHMGSPTGPLIATTTTNVNGSYVFNIINQMKGIVTYVAYFPGASVVGLTMRPSMKNVRVGLEGVSLLPLLILGGALLVLTQK